MVGGGALNAKRDEPPRLSFRGTRNLISYGVDRRHASQRWRWLDEAMGMSGKWLDSSRKRKWID